MNSTLNYYPLIILGKILKNSISFSTPQWLSIKCILGPGFPYKITFPTRKVERSLQICQSFALQWQVPGPPSVACLAATRLGNVWFNFRFPTRFLGPNKKHPNLSAAQPLRIKGPSGGLFKEISSYTTKKCNKKSSVFSWFRGHTA